MKKLLKIYGLNSDMQYYEMIADSFTNGQNSQAREQFKALPKENKKDLLKLISSDVWDCHIMKINVRQLIDQL
jgi:hypothetical protein